ncbi:MAG TPA: hypothetical protein VD966_13810, partial [Pyrinomonadaceae bacterium]|nr:hypothetical protein [Pyrinomonadaceae bacterium]
ALPGAALLIGERLALLIRGQWDGRLAMRATGVLLILVAVTGMIYAVRSVHATIDSALIIIAPAVVAGLIALVRPHLRQLCLAAIICAVFGATVLAINFAAEAVARRESAFELLSRAAARGYASSPVFQLHTIERTSEFYAAGRVAYGPDGELIKFEGVSEVADAARQSVGPVLVIVPVEYTGQLTGFTPFETEIIGDNGTVALVAVRLRKPSE